MFQTKLRTDGTPYTVLSDDAPDYLRDAVRTAHQGHLPNDFHYEVCEAAYLSPSGAPDDALSLLLSNAPRIRSLHRGLYGNEDGIPAEISRTIRAFRTSLAEGAP